MHEDRALSLRDIKCNPGLDRLGPFSYAPCGTLSMHTSVLSGIFDSSPGQSTSLACEGVFFEDADVLPLSAGESCE